MQSCSRQHHQWHNKKNSKQFHLFCQRKESKNCTVKKSHKLYTSRIINQRHCVTCYICANKCWKCITLFDFSLQYLNLRLLLRRRIFWFPRRGFHISAFEISAAGILDFRSRLCEYVCQHVTALFLFCKFFHSFRASFQNFYV